MSLARKRSVSVPSSFGYGNGASITRRLRKRRMVIVMDTSDERCALSRAAALRHLAAVPAVGLALAGSLRAAEAAGTAPKSQYKYQDSPKNGQQCSGCQLFIPGSSPTAKGQCQLVAGDISPSGWCTAWTAKK